MPKTFSKEDLAAHNTPDDVWLAINDQVYDFTDFAPNHPGGVDIIYRYAGKDASEEYNSFHAPSLVQKALDAKYHLGPFNAPNAKSKQTSDSQSDSAYLPESSARRPPLHDIINLHDFEKAASTGLAEKEFAYISGGSNDNLTRDANASFLGRIWLRPAVMRNVRTVHTNTEIFGCKLQLPVYISPTGRVRTGGEEGEVALAKGAAKTGNIQTLATPSSFPHEEVLDATPQQAFFQLYVNKDRKLTEELLRKVTKTGKIKALLVTADLPVVSKREADERVRSETVGPREDWKGAGLARQTGSFIDPSLSWEDITWLRRLTDLPIVIKGIQRWEDAKLAMKYGVQGIVLSNHGGRAADTAPPSILLLLELHRNCPEVFGKLVVLIDGGFRRGSDVLKAICLGASAVGLGRPFAFSVGYGEDGVVHAFNILQDELETAMRLCGITDLADASPDFVNTLDIDHLVRVGGHPYARKVPRVSSKL
ncbi:putative CYB2-L-lactate dehydrogenase (cytochrome b2) [Fusarium austroafricanum]|uniref:Putative CYB2-L-lactate dehydrogenase (Cytochrome b2) n=1 Tax=Fusarium austroafricanum TaxID=2364996 RepID=A0A8H4NS04_9HYPO|nr:putative CYB2-L-lactate dehydrogenase (cytochrome b2) [Fusarium austroafricanum]